MCKPRGKKKLKNKAQASKSIVSEVIYTTETWHEESPKIKPFSPRHSAQYSGMKPIVKHGIYIVVYTGMVKEKDMYLKFVDF